MSSHSVILDEMHFRVAEEKARALGQTPEQYLAALIDADSRSFDEILDPVRRGFDAMSDGEVDELFERARAAARGQGRRVELTSTSSVPAKTNGAAERAGDSAA